MAKSPEPRISPLSSLHTHSHYCDGHGELEEYARSTVDRHLYAYGASGHAPLPFLCDYALPLAKLDEYVGEVQRLQQAYRDRLTILLGLELDYLPGLEGFYERELFSRQLDYVVGSVHYVGEPGVEPWVYDESRERFVAEIAQRHGGNVRPVVEDYFRRVRAMVRDSQSWPVPVIVGHLDRFSIWNRDNEFFSPDSDWYESAVAEALQAIAASRCVLEVNTSGWNKLAAVCNPSPKILRQAVELNISIIVSADAHRPENVDQHYARAVQLLRECGATTIAVPSDGGWSSVPLPESA